MVQDPGSSLVRPSPAQLRLQSLMLAVPYEGIETFYNPTVILREDALSSL